MRQLRDDVTFREWNDALPPLVCSIANLERGGGYWEKFVEGFTSEVVPELERRRITTGD